MSNNGNNGGGKGLLAAVAIFGVLALLAGRFASDPSNNGNPADKYVKDAAGILSGSTKQLIVDVNDGLEKDYGGAQLVVATVKSLDGEHIKIYAKQFFKLNDIGSRKNQNGMLLLVSKEDNDYYAMYGSGLPDFLAGDVAVALDSCMKQAFLAGDYDTAVSKTVPELAKALKNAWKSGNGGNQQTGPATQNTDSNHVAGEASVSQGSLGLGFLFKRLFRILIGGVAVVILGIVALALLLVFVFKNISESKKNPETGTDAIGPEIAVVSHKSSKSTFKPESHRSSGKSSSITMRSSDRRKTSENRTE